MLGHLSAVETLDSHMCQEVDIEESEGLIVSKLIHNSHSPVLSIVKTYDISNQLLYVDGFEEQTKSRTKSD